MINIYLLIHLFVCVCVCVCVCLCVCVCICVSVIYIYSDLAQSGTKLHILLTHAITSSSIKSLTHTKKQTKKTCFCAISGIKYT